MYPGIRHETELSDDTWAVDIGIPQSITWFITCRLHQQSSILYTCGASWLHWRWWHHQNQTGEHADCWFPAPVWFSGYRPSPPPHHRQVELPSLTTTLPCQSPVYMSTHGIYLQIKKLTCIHKKWIQGVFMEHCTKTRLISMAFQGHFNLYAWKINIGEHSPKYQVSYGYYQNDSKRWFYL